MTRHEKIFTALSVAFDITPLNEQIDDFEITLLEQGLQIIFSDPFMQLKESNKPVTIISVDTANQ